MPPLPRGICPVCRQEVALRNEGLIREHRRRIGPKMVEEKVCRGSGQAAIR